MRVVAILVLLGAATAAVLFALGVLGEGGGTSPDLPPREGPTPGTSSGGGTLRGPPPAEEPPLELLPFEGEISVLLLVGVPQRIPAFLGMVWDEHPRIAVRSWAPAPQGPGTPPGDALPGPLASAPAAGLLDGDGYDVVVVHDLDPAALGGGFWKEVARRVAEGRLGLLVGPGVRTGAALLGHETLGAVLPASGARPLEGSPLPGDFQGEFAPFVVTEVGTSHPASRLVGWPEWSRAIWRGTQSGDAPWGTSFCYPVERAVPGASTLLLARSRTGDEYPALIAAAEEQGRVLWLGAFELGPRSAYGRPDVTERWRVLVLNWVVWLSGRMVQAQ